MSHRLRKPTSLSLKRAASALGRLQVEHGLEAQEAFLKAEAGLRAVAEAAGTHHPSADACGTTIKRYQRALVDVGRFFCHLDELVGEGRGATTGRTATRVDRAVRALKLGDAASSLSNEMNDAEYAISRCYGRITPAEKGGGFVPRGASSSAPKVPGAVTKAAHPTKTRDWDV